MKAFALSLLALSGANAFAPSRSSSSRCVSLKASSELEGMLGVSIETGNEVWDPLECAKWAPAEHLRKAELANGRSAMLAIVGWYWPSVFGTFNSKDVTTVDPIKAVLEADPQWWAQFIIFCGTVEFIKYRGEQEGKSYTGDGPAVIDWSYNWEKLDAAQKEDMALKELKNGRLAMIGIAGALSNYLIPGSVPFLTKPF